jgi:hypothetical protein
MMDIELIEIDGKHWVTITEDGRELKRRGPFLSTAVAQAMVNHLHELLEIPKNDVDAAAAKLPALIKDHSFVEDLARFADGTYSEQAIRKKYRLEESDWDALGKNDALVREIEDRKLHRIRNGATKRERAQIEIVNGPPVLAKIMKDPNANQRHIIDAVKALNDLAAPEPKTTGPDPSERFIITINLGNDEKLTFNKSIKPTPHDVDPNELKTIEPPQELLAIAAANKREGGNSDEPI